ncbi:hypothetical protein niasHT_011462 [Heterodera trifolii]|uniref:Uncharacterized protein n=1 Tax=Heterodera trifolii TaxID=157864 RepID=A0ABD2L1X9_9BILA
MKFLFVLFSIVCFGFAVCVGQQHSLQVQLEPSLYGDQHYYQVTATCTTNGTVPSLIKTSDEFELQNNAYNIIELKLFKNFCTSLKYQISVTMVHRKDRCQKIWQSQHLSENLADKPVNFLHVKFANHFKLTISPEMLENSKMSYRVEVYCSCNDQIEFKTYTSFSTMVVFNSVERKCNYYDIKVWAFNYRYQLERLTLLPIVVESGVKIENGQIHQIFLKNCFNLRIHPSISSNNTTNDDGHIYFVAVKCNGIEGGQLYRTITEEIAQIVLHEQNECVSYDIKVCKISSQMPKKYMDALTGGLSNGQQLLGVQIPNGHTYQFNFVTFEAQQPSTPSSTWNTKVEMKRLSSEIDTLGTEVKQLKNDVEQMRESIKTGLTEIKEFLSKRLKN